MSARDQIEVAGVLLLVRARLRVERPRRPLAIQDRVERRHAVRARGSGVGAVVEHETREVEAAVDDGDEQRRRAVPRARLVDVGARVEQRADGSS